jgi:triphosphatase
MFSKANHAGALRGQDAEYLHQMRVALRRLRALSSLYADLLRARERKAMVRELRWLAQTLGPARDADVFAEDIWPPLRAALGDSALMRDLDRMWQAARRREAVIAHRALASQRHEQLMQHLEHWVRQPPWMRAGGREPREDQEARDFGRAALDRHVRRVRAAGRARRRHTAEDLHRWRVRIKKLRYIMDALGALFPVARVRKTLEALSALQDVLGELNDLAVAAQKLDAALLSRRDVDVAQLQQRFQEWQALQWHERKGKLDRAWRDFRHTEPFW